MATEITSVTATVNTATELDSTAINEVDEKDFTFEPTKDGHCLLYIKNNDTNNIDVTISGGDFNLGEVLGSAADLTQADIAQNDVFVFGPFESARFKNEDGEIEVTVTTDGTAGTDEDVDIAVIELDY